MVINLLLVGPPTCRELAPGHAPLIFEWEALRAPAHQLCRHKYTRIVAEPTPIVAVPVRWPLPTHQCATNCEHRARSWLTKSVLHSLPNNRFFRNLLLPKSVYSLFCILYIGGLEIHSFNRPIFMGFWLSTDAVETQSCCGQGRQVLLADKHQGWKREEARQGRHV
jgi:hypothetical protein